ncbi:MAG: 30S ribosomal protein S3 [Oscillospiraceae bacterium]|jgi:small subunit ribosomal protein S3|nr:30S ribosomal protein S3 [Oscillospiraceae bacterium]
MGQKVNPYGLRVGVNKGWLSMWFADKKTFSKNLIEDYKLRAFLKKALREAGVPAIEIKRDASTIRITVYCARPGRVIGEGGKNIERMRLACVQLVGKEENRRLFLTAVEVKGIDANAQLVAENVALQLEKRISFRRAMKQSIQRAMNAGVQGIKVMVAGRLGGAEIARTEQYHDGTIPLQTLRANIDYGFAEANTTYGKIGVKVWIYKGDILGGSSGRVVREGGRS